MSRRIKGPPLRTVLVVLLSFLQAREVIAQTLKILVSFAPIGPQTGLILVGDTLYGTTPSTIFTINTNGTGFTNLYGFNLFSLGTESAG